MKKLAALTLSLVMILGVFSGCASSGAQSTANASGAKKENVVTIARQGDMTTWNYFMATDGLAITYGRLIYDSLMNLDDKGNYIPSLASSWKVSDDGKQVTFKLRSDVKFHNGDQFTSADVKYTLEKYILDKTTRTNNDWSLLTSVDTPDAQTAVFNFKQPFAALYSQLVYTFIMDKKACEAQGDKVWNNPIGTGAWKFVSWTAGQQMVFQRNDDYWNWGSNKSNVDKIIIKPVSEDSTRLAAIQSGDADIAEPLTPDQAKQIQGNKDIKIEDTLNSGLTQFWFSNNGVFADENVRKAFSLAIDRETIVKTIIGGGKATDWPVDSSCMGYKDVKPTFDPAKAKELLASSTYKGQPIKISAVTGQVARISEVLQAIVSQLNAVGFKATINFMEMAALNSQRQSGNYDVYFVSVKSIAGDTGSMVMQRVYNDMYKSGYKNEQLFSLIKAQSSEIDQKKRADIFSQIYQMTYDTKAPFISAYQIDTIAAYKSSISGVRFLADSFTDYSRIMKK